MKTITTTIVIVLAGFFTVVSSHTSLAQEVVAESDYIVNTRAIGMGNAQIAAGEDASSLIFNPATLVTVDRFEGQLGLSILKRETSTTLRSSIGTGKKNGIIDNSGLGSFGIAYPFPTERGSLVVALGYHRVSDFNGRLEINGYNDYLMGFQQGDSLEEGGLGIVSLGGAVDISPHVSVGISLDIWSGNYTRDNRMLLNDETETYSQLDITGVEDDISAWSIKPGLLYRTQNFRLGAYARLPMTFHIKEHNYLEWYSRSDGNYFRLHEIIDPTSEFTDDAYSDYLEYQVKAPMQLGVGGMWGTPGKNCIAVDFVYENWREAQLRYPANYVSEPNYFSDKYRSNMQWRIGYERMLPFFKTVGRIGYICSPLIFKGPRGTEPGEPFISVANERDFLTLGLGKELDETISVDIGYAHGFWSQKETPRKENESYNKFSVFLTYQMPKGK